MAKESGAALKPLQRLFVRHVITLPHSLPDLAAFFDEDRVALEQQVQHLVIQGKNREIALFLGLQDYRLGAGFLQHRSDASVGRANLLDRHVLALPDSVAGSSSIPGGGSER